MERTELRRIVEYIIMTDPFTSSHSDYQNFTLEECAAQLEECRKYNIDLNPEDQIPDDLTAEELKTIWDEIVDAHWEALRPVAREFLLHDGNNDFPYNKFIEDCKERHGYIPHPWIYTDTDDFRGRDCDEEVYSIHDFAKIAMRSPDYDPDKLFYWYDGTKLHSANYIYPDIDDVDRIVDYCITHRTGLDYAIEELM